MSTGPLPKALVIVEGENLEPRFFDHVARLCGMDLEFVPFKSNIYLLYSKLKEYGFDYGIKALLKEVCLPHEDHAVLDQKFAYIYLVFDCDAHHSGLMHGGVEPQDINSTVLCNYGILKEMVEYFSDETDPDRGKLYVNYPMMESYRDLDSFDDDGYRNRFVFFEDIGRYKGLVGERTLSSYRIDRISNGQFNSLTRLQLCKLSEIVRSEWCVPSYESYSEMSTQESVLDAQIKFIQQSRMAVLNTSLFLPVDYFGNRDGRYDRLFT